MDLVVVLGVHRSGTSLVTSGVNALGFDLSQQEVESDANNPTGYNEQVRVRAFNDRLLAFLGTSWDDWTFRVGLVDWDAPELLPWILEAGTILTTIFEGVPKGVLKDPRITTLFPFWRRVFGQSGWQVRYILAMRDPSEVAQSQVTRARRDPDRNLLIRSAEPMLALWTVTLHYLLEHAPDQGFLAIDFKMLHASPALALQAIALHLDVQPSADVLSAFQLTQVRPDLYRSHAAPIAERSTWHAAAAELWEAFRSDDAKRFDPASCAAILERTTAIDVLFLGLEAAHDTIAAALASRASIASAPEILWYLTPIVMQYAPPERLRELLSIIEMIAIGSDHSPSVMHLKAGLYECLGNPRHAIQVFEDLHRLRPGDDLVSKRLSGLRTKVGLPDRN